MRDVLAQGGQEVAFAVEECPVQTLTAGGAYPTSRVRVRSGRPRWAAHDPDALRGEHRVERGGELRIPITDQELVLVDPVAEIHDQVSACWVTHCPVECAVAPRTCTRRVAISTTNST